MKRLIGGRLAMLMATLAILVGVPAWRVTTRPAFAQTVGTDYRQPVAQLDTSPPYNAPRDNAQIVEVDVYIADFLPPASDAKTDEDVLSNGSGAEKVPSMEKDGAAWLAWAEKHGRLEVLNRPKVMTRDNQPAIIRMGTTAPIGAPKLGTDGPARENQIEQTEGGWTIGVTPQILPQGMVSVKLDYECVSVRKREATSDPTVQKMSIQTTISAKDGQTAVLGGLMERGGDGQRQMIIAVTPCVNPTKR